LLHLPNSGQVQAFFAAARNLALLLSFGTGTCFASDALRFLGFAVSAVKDVFFNPDRAGFGRDAFAVAEDLPRCLDCGLRKTVSSALVFLLETPLFELLEAAVVDFVFPDFVVDSLVVDDFLFDCFDCEVFAVEGFVMDGFPRADCVRADFMPADFALAAATINLARDVDLVSSCVVPRDVEDAGLVDERCVGFSAVVLVFVVRDASVFIAFVRFGSFACCTTGSADSIAAVLTGLRFGLLVAVGSSLTFIFAAASCLAFRALS